MTSGDLQTTVAQDASRRPKSLGARRGASGFVIITLAAVGILASGAMAEGAVTYCNPLPLPDVPISRNCKYDSWTNECFRELADPSLLVEGRTIYVYPSNGMAWKSTDGAATWTKVDIGIEDVGYAPTVVRHRNRYLLLAGENDLYAADSPEGPFRSLGPVEHPNDGSPDYFDPMLFADDDGRLYLYFGCTADRGIWGLELNAANPRRIVQPARQLVKYDSKTWPWERQPTQAKDDIGWMEGGWMVKVNGRYCLTYASSGTQYETYATGAAWGTSPLGPFVKQRKNPFFRTVGGFVRGTSHGSVVPDPWVPGGFLKAYTVAICKAHRFERLIGLDRVRLDANGDFAVSCATDAPQFADGSGAVPWYAVPFSSEGHPEMTDGRITTSSAVGPLPATIEFVSPYHACVRAFRIVWREHGLDKKGMRRGPVRYRLEAFENGKWVVLLDASGNARDLMVDYRETARGPRSNRLRLTVLGLKDGISLDLAEFTAFGE